jgi:hypothetical protein
MWDIIRLLHKNTDMYRNSVYRKGEHLPILHLKCIINIFTVYKGVPKLQGPPGYLKNSKTESFPLLSCYAAISGNFSQTLLENLSVTAARAKKPKKKTGGCVITQKSEVFIHFAAEA